MITLHLTSAHDYQQSFYRQIGLTPDQTQSSGASFVWQNPDVGYIHTFGDIDTLQLGVGAYTIPCDFVSSYEYEFAYLHFGLITKGFSYEVEESTQNDQVETATEGTGRLAASPSAFVSIETSPVRPIKWDAGQRFAGTEFSITLDHLQSSLLPALQMNMAQLAYLHPNTRYTHLPSEMRTLIEQARTSLEAQTMTIPILRAFAMGFIALLGRPDMARAIQSGELMASERLQVGNHTVLVTSQDFRKIAQAHQILTNEATAFPSVALLAKRVDISEQKLKAGFSHVYQQTPWEFANTVRMDLACNLLRDTSLTVREVASQVGYQSSASFITMFRQYSGLTPNQFRQRTRTLYREAQ